MGIFGRPVCAHPSCVAQRGAPVAERAPVKEPQARSRPRIRRFLLEAVVFVGIVLAVSAWQTRHLVSPGTPAPDFELEALDGTRTSLASLHGKRVLLHFWATWCGVCRQELPALNAVQGHLGADETLLTIVADSEDREGLRKFVAEHGIRYPVLLATPELLRAFHIDAFPTNYYLSPEGIVRSRTVGMSTRLSFRARLALSR